MKKILLTVACLLLSIPVFVSAQTEVNTLKEALEKEEIEISIDDYVETDNQVTIYLFWGSGCPHCQDFLEFLNDNLEEYKDKVKLRAYEVWYNTDNAKIQEKVRTFFGSTTGVPLIIVGNTPIVGFGTAETTGVQIKNAIESEYAKAVSERYDVFVEMEKESDNTEDKKSNTPLLIFGGIVIVVIVGAFILSLKSKKA